MQWPRVEGPATETGRRRAVEVLSIEVNASKPGVLVHARKAMAALSAHPSRALRWVLMAAGLVVLIAVPGLNLPFEAADPTFDTTTVADIQPSRIGQPACTTPALPTGAEAASTSAVGRLLRRPARCCGSRRCHRRCADAGGRTGAASC